MRAPANHSVIRWRCGTGGVGAIWSWISTGAGTDVLLHLAGVFVERWLFLLKRNMWSAFTMVTRIDQKWHLMRHDNNEKGAAQW